MRPNGGTAKQQGTPMEKVQKRGGGDKKIVQQTKMVKITMALKMHVYVVISLERQKQRIEKKYNRKIMQSLIKHAQGILLQYLPT